MGNVLFSLDQLAGPSASERPSPRSHVGRGSLSAGGTYGAYSHARVTAKRRYAIVDRSMPALPSSSQ